MNPLAGILLLLSLAEMWIIARNLREWTGRD